MVLLETTSSRKEKSWRGETGQVLVPLCAIARLDCLVTQENLALYLDAPWVPPSSPWLGTGDWSFPLKSCEY